jgi:hypothetical protein
MRPVGCNSKIKLLYDFMVLLNDLHSAGLSADSEISVGPGGGLN